jgi:hypothetical protein
VGTQLFVTFYDWQLKHEFFVESFLARAREHFSRRKCLEQCGLDRLRAHRDSASRAESRHVAFFDHAASSIPRREGRVASLDVKDEVS